MHKSLGTNCVQQVVYFVGNLWSIFEVIHQEISRLVRIHFYTQSFPTSFPLSFGFFHSDVVNSTVVDRKYSTLYTGTTITTKLIKKYKKGIK